MGRAALRCGNMERQLNGEFPEHAPVLLDEVLAALACKPGAIIVDGTIGLGGHATAILQRIQPGGTLIGIDRDRESLEIARGRLAVAGAGLRLIHDNFKNLPLILNNLGMPEIDGILVDLGVSSFQLLSKERGFSFQHDAMLDMRMDRSQRPTAADLVNELPQGELADLIYRYGEEPASRRIAAAIVEEREKTRLQKCTQLAELVSRSVRVRGLQRTHPATRTFQALRIAVNRELDGLEEFIAAAVDFLRPGGRMAVISFHSLEDRIVKRAVRRLAGQCVCERPPQLCGCPRKAVIRLVPARAVRPGPAEIERNPRSRSAKMRCAERLPQSGGEGVESS